LHLPAAELAPVLPTPLAESLPRLRTCVSPLTGIVRTVDETLAAPDEHRLVHIACGLADGRPTLGGPVEGHAASEQPLREAAEAAAIGEALERYSASFVPAGRLVVRSADRLPRTVDPGRFALFHDLQYADPAFPFRAFRRDTVVAWVDGFALAGGAPAYLPAQVTFLAWGHEPLPRSRSRMRRAAALPVPRPSRRRCSRASWSRSSATR